MAFTFQVLISEKDWVQIHRYKFWLRYPRRLVWAATISLKLGALGCLWWMLEKGANVATVWGFLIFSALGLQLLYLPITRREKAKTEYRKHQKDFATTQVALSEAGLALESERGRWNYPWEQIALVETPTGWMFCDGSRDLIFWLPWRVVPDEITREQARLLMNEQRVKVRQIT